MWHNKVNEGKINVGETNSSGRNCEWKHVQNNETLRGHWRRR